MKIWYPLTITHSAVWGSFTINISWESDRKSPGFAKLHFAPYPDERLGGVSGSYLSVAGKIESAWRYEADGCHIRLATPVEAVVLLPDGRSENVPAGTYEWTVKRPNL